jgi:hypothetical protein
VNRVLLAAGLAGFCLGSALPAIGNDLEPQIRLMQGGATQLIKDMETVMSLTSEEEQKQTPEIKEYLDLSFLGMSYDRLMRMDVITGDGKIRYRPAFPLKDEKVFWEENLIPNGIQKKRRIRAGFCSTKGAFEGYMRVRADYAIFGEKTGDLPDDAPPPTEEIAHLAKLTTNAAMELVNDPTGVDFRKESYNNSEKGVRAALMNEIVKTKTETQDAFDLRKLSFSHQLDELERIYTDAAKSLLVAKFDPVKKTATMDFELIPIPKTTLASSIETLNQSPLSFANVPKSAKSNMSLRAKFPLDEMRQQNLTETIELLRTISHKEVEKSETKTTDQKDVSEEVVDLSFNLLLANVKGGMADGFLESHANPDGTNTAVMAFKAVDGNAPLAILKLLEKTRDGQKVMMDLAEEGGVKIHSFLISEEQHPGFRNFFGGYEVFVGTSADTIWLASGAQAVEEMKAAIREVAKPNAGKASDSFFTLSGRAAPWLALHEKSYPESGSDAFRNYRRLMIEAGEPGDDQFDAWLNRDGENVVGKFSAESGWTRFLGKYLADFAKKNL